jgi:TetR/AcrR family transcriptional regulator, transcriptional repressor for nem operon
MTLKETIIHESMKLFSLNGFLGTSIDDILSASNSSKGGFYNHFKSKEDLFLEVLDEARKIWRDRNLKGLSQNQDALTNIKKLLINFRDVYLKNSESFPGGCIFIMLMVEVKNQRPHLSKEIKKGFVGLKNMIKRYLEEAKDSGQLKNGADTDEMSEILFNGMLGAAVSYNGKDSDSALDAAINSMIKYVERFE